MKWLKWAGIAVSLAALLGVMTLSRINDYQIDGEITFPSLDKPVEVIRDEKGMAYIHAENLTDAIKAQGYITAQDRLFQMQLTRTLVSGRLAEVFGEQALASDKLQRTLGFYRAAQQHEAILSPHTRRLFDAYAQGVTQYIKEAENEYPIEMGLAGLTARPWTTTDSLAIMYYMGWGSAANIKAEIMSQKLIEKLGIAKYLTVSPIAINPGDNSPLDLITQARKSDSAYNHNTSLHFNQDNLLSRIENVPNDLATGSNNWAVSPAKSVSSGPIVVNDPHLSTRMLPTIFYPIGLFSPKTRAVGANVPGIPGLIVGRNQYVAAGVTNQYGDAQDLYVETVDPDNSSRYMEGDTSLPFKELKESIRIKDESQEGGFRTEDLIIKLTRRGPVISKVHAGLETDNVITVRWSALETMKPDIGVDSILLATSVDDFKQSLNNFSIVHLNYVFADIHGDIAWQTTGKLPIRNQGDGTTPFKVFDDTDNWTGWIPFAEMPQSHNPEKGWLGTANNKTVTNDYPYYYSNWFAPNNRYQRITELLDTPGETTVDDHWQFMRDAQNVTARDISPILANALKSHEQTREIGDLLSQWDFIESVDSVATSIYQETYRHLVERVFRDELGEELLHSFLGSPYFWQERFGLMLKNGHSEWFDDITTPNKTETLNELILYAGLKTIDDLSSRIGTDPTEWQWGKIHQIEFLNPIRRQGIGKHWLGGGRHPMAGSGDTVLRARYPLNNDDHTVQYSATLRMVIDLADNDKVLAVSPGGVSGRTFTPHFTDQIDAYMNGDKMYWWFSDAKIQEHGVSTLVLRP